MLNSKELAETAKTVAEIYNETRCWKVSTSVEKMIEEVGLQNLLEVVSAMVQCKENDGRISKSVIKLAKEIDVNVPTAYGRHDIKYFPHSEDIHPSSLDQIAWQLFHNKEIYNGEAIWCLSVNVFRNSDGSNCTNGGISSKYNTLLVQCDEGNHKVFLKNHPENLCKIVKEHHFGEDFLHIEPFDEPESLGWMAGGNIAYSCDSRFSRMSEYPLCIYDRQETQELYNFLSE